MASGADVKTGTPGHRQIVDLIVLMGLGVLQAWAFFDGNLGLSGDNAAYMVLGAALATDSGYVHIGHPAQPLETKFPPGFPVLLAGVYLLFDGDLLAMKWFVALLYALSVPVVYLLVRAHDSRPMAIVVSALCLVSTPLLELSHSAMSEIPYMVASFVALLLLARGRSSHLSLVLAGASAVAAYYIRTVGVTVVATVAGWLLIQRRLKVADVVAAVAAIPIAAWVHFAATHGQGAYIRALVSVNAYRPELGYLTPLALLERAYGNLQLYGLQFVPEILLPYPFNHVSVWFRFPGRLVAAGSNVHRACVLLPVPRRAVERSAVSGALYWRADCVAADLEQHAFSGARGAVGPVCRSLECAGHSTAVRHRFHGVADGPLGLPCPDLVF